MKPKHQNRQYQTEIEEAVINHLFNKEGNPIVASPGGTGKSFVMAKLIKRFVVEYPGTTVIVLAQDSKLLEQNCNELLRYWEYAPCGIYSAGLKQRDTHHPIIFAGIQSCAKKPAIFGKRHIILIDEADQVSPKEQTLYQKFIDGAKKLNPNLKIIGFTATPYRLGVGCLTNLDMWSEICIDLTKTEQFNAFIENGYLSPLVTKRPTKEIDVTNVSMRGGDFDEHSLAEVTDTDELNKAVVEETIRYGMDRKHWLIFATGIKHGHKLAKLFNARGVPTAMLTGEDKMEHRKEIEGKWRSGEIRAVVNVGLYGRGYDFPGIDLIVWARATQSTAYWVQGCLRGTRIAPDKDSATVLDFAGNIRRLGPVNDPIVPAPRRKGEAVKGEAPIKECPQCHSYIHTRIMVCPDCGYVFPPPSTIKKTAETADILRKTSPTGCVVEDHEVLGVRYKPTMSKNGNYYLRVTYSTFAHRFHAYKFFDSGAMLTQRENKNWWIHCGGNLPVPGGVDEAADRAVNELGIPKIVRVDVSEKYPRVVGVDFDEE